MGVGDEGMDRKYKKRDYLKRNSAMSNILWINRWESMRHWFLIKKTVQEYQTWDI